MRNLIRIQDTLHSIQFQTSEGDKNVIAERLGDDNIVSIACSQALGKLYLLTASGILICFENHDGLSWKYSTKLLFEDMVEDWFKVDYVAVTNTVVCISRQGSLVCIEEDAVDGNPIGEPDQIGVIEGGIVAASWHPDYSCLVIFTNNNTILSMSNSWEVLNEVQFPHKVVNSKADLSWKGDGEMLSIVSIDEVDGVSKVRILNPQLEIVATSRNVGEGAASVMKGIGCVVAFATNGAYVAAHQVKPGGEGHAVALVEKNGLKHGDFDIRTPAVPVQHKPWEVTALDWDLPSTLLAVAMRSYPIDKSSSTINFVGCVQVYYRENYHWYLKQQWVDHDLTWLGFDSELANRLYLSQLVEIPSLSGIIYDQALRVVDIYWSVSRTETRDSTVCVSDGSSLLLTPLGYHSVPPPMSMYQENLAAFQANWKFSVASQVSFWNTESARGKCWGMSTLLSDKADTVIHLGDDRGKVTKLFGFELDKTIESLLKSEVGGESEEVANELLLLIRQVRFRQVLITEGDGQVIVHFIGSKALSHYINIDLDAPLMISSRTGAQPVVADDFVVSLIATSNDFYAATTPDSAIVRNSGIFKAFRLLNGFTGAIYYASHIFNAVHDIALGVHHASTGDYEVVSLSHKDFQWTVDGEEVPIVLWLHQDDRQFERHVIATVPEVSPLFTVISNAQAIAEEEERLKAQAVAGISSSGASSTPALPSVDQEIKEFTVIALSNRNRLYCSDILLVAGASSYAFNHSFNLLMFITLGTKPHLHFSSLTTLQRLSAMQAADEEGVANGICFECAEARPVERGAKLVTSVANDSKVVIQLPRGNLEIFEPRPMILLKAQRLLVVDALSSVSPQLLECLVLLRRQRVDLNYLVDFNPVIFLEQAHNFVRQALGVAGSTYNQDRSDLLSLFITSLDPQDVTMTKYVYFDRTMFAQRVQRREYIIKNKFEQDTKVNRVCECLRQSLLTLLQEEHCLQAMNPLLCTYAKQRPPLLVDALKLIKSITTSSASGSSASVRGVSMTSAIKYLAFLAEGSQIFDAALGVCDFDMARAIARQCQMDPKVYLPLLEGFESIAKGFSITSSLGYLMLYRVNKHLKRNEVATEAFCKLIRTLHEDDVKWSNNDSGTLESEVAGGKIISKEQVQSLISTAEKELLPQVIEIVKEDNSFHTIMMRMNGLEKEFSRTLVSTSSSTQLIRRFITAVRKGYAEKQLSEMNYSGAITAFLSTHPPCAVEAVEAALSQGNWLNALSIAGRYHSSILDANGKKRSALDPTRIAQEIVSSYRSNQEFVSFMGDVEESEQQWVSASPPSSSMASDEEDKALLAARLSIDYCQDAESAVAILVTAQKWSRAIEVASQQHRLDLFDEVCRNG